MSSLDVAVATGTTAETVAPTKPSLTTAHFPFRSAKILAWHLAKLVIV